MPPNPIGGDTLSLVTDPILLFLTLDVVALLLLGTCVAALPLAACGFLATTLSGLGLLLCLPPLLTGTAATALSLPVGPPGLKLHLALDPLSAFFLAVVFLAGTAIAAFQATTSPPTGAGPIRTTAFCLAGTAMSVLAADGVALAIGLAISCGAIWLPRSSRTPLLIPLLLLAATCLLAPAGFAPGFDAIRAAPVDPNRAAVAAMLTGAAIAGLVWSPSAERCWTRGALTTGVVIPSAAYLLLRLITELPAAATPMWCGFVLLLAGAAATVIHGWRAASLPDIDTSVLCLARRQAGLTMTGIGLALIARVADLPGAASFALASVFLAVIGSAAAGVLSSLAAETIAASAGTYRLSRLGGLAHAMPATSFALAVGLLGLSALPPGVGFAGLWLLFQSILSGPRIGGLPFQLPLALTGAAIAVSAALTTAGSLRLIGIAVLGRPRSPRGAGARESRSATRTILLILAGLSLPAGFLPGSTLWLLGDPAIQALTGAHTGLAWMSPFDTVRGYFALPVFALLALTTGGVILAARWSPREARITGPWTDGMTPPVGLPFGEPAAQSAGEGFLPSLPDMALPWRPRLPAFVRPRPPSATMGPWLILAAFAALLLLLAVAG
jgi:formate hydrogenlyase subunit 3/multisubunit Na+/H+ antiporter MnhD subunit